MNLPLRALLLPLVLLLSVVGYASAGPYEDGLAAFQSTDYEKALGLLQPLAKQGNAGAQFHLGLMFNHGFGVEPDLRKAMDWYRLAEKQGHKGARSNLDTLPTFELDTEPLLLAAKKGDANAQYELGVMYEARFGFDDPLSSSPSLPEFSATKWYGLAAENGHAKAQLKLCTRDFWYSGYGADEPRKLRYKLGASEWCALAAKNNVAQAQLFLGMMYVGGHGVGQDYVQALKWWTLAANAGDEAAMDASRELAAAMTPDQIAQAQRLAREWKPKAE